MVSENTHIVIECDVDIETTRYETSCLKQIVVSLFPCSLQLFTMQLRPVGVLVGLVEAPIFVDQCKLLYHIIMESI
jgi:hypothetical protein